MYFTPIVRIASAKNIIQDFYNLELWDFKVQFML